MYTKTGRVPCRCAQPKHMDYWTPLRFQKKHREGRRQDRGVRRGTPAVQNEKHLTHSTGSEYSKPHSGKRENAECQVQHGQTTRKVTGSWVLSDKSWICLQPQIIWKEIPVSIRMWSSYEASLSKLDLKPAELRELINRCYRVLDFCKFDVATTQN